MKNRQLNIIYQLASSEKPLTAEEIAKRLDISARTIKTEMQDIKENLPGYGASLIAKRNRGYSIQIDDLPTFKAFIEQLSLKLTMVYNFALDDMARFLYISRKLVSSSKYAKIDDIADELNTSRSTLRDSIRKSMVFLESYNMVTESKPGLGIRTYGKEYHARVAMMELYAIHFHKAQLDNVGMEYAKWVDCDKKERQDIRHNFLRTLVPSGISILDVYTQRLAIYLIITRNRYIAGYRLKLPEKWIEEMKPYWEYQVALAIYTNLSKEVSGYDLPEEEVAFLAILLLCNRDMGHIRISNEKFPTLYDEVSKYAKEILEKVKSVHNIDLDQFTWVYEELRSILVPMIAREHFELSGAKTISYHHDNQISESPLALEIARTIAGYLQKNAGEKVAEIAAVNKLTCFVYKVLFMVSYDIKKVKLLIINYDGINFSEFCKKRLLTAFESLIESFTCVELYEIRGLNMKEYDAVIMDTLEFAYNYELSESTLHTISREGELNAIYNKILVHAYRFQQLLPKNDMIQVYQDFEYLSEEQFFQLISFKHCLSSVNQKLLENTFLAKERMITYRNCNQSVVLFGDVTLTEDEAVEIYFLKKPGIWGGGEINYIMYVCLNWQNNSQKVKALENSLCQLTIHPEYYNLFLEDKATAFEKMVYQALKL